MTRQFAPQAVAGLGPRRPRRESQLSNGGSRAAAPLSPRVVAAAALSGLAALSILAVSMLVFGASSALAASLEERFTVCLACHGAGGVSRVPETPSLAAQPQFFTVAQLFLFRDGRRTTPP